MVQRAHVTNRTKDSPRMDTESGRTDCRRSVLDSFRGLLFILNEVNTCIDMQIFSERGTHQEQSIPPQFHNGRMDQINQRLKFFLSIQRKNR